MTSMAHVLEQLRGQVRVDLAAGTVAVGAVEARQEERRELVRELGTLIYTHFHVGHHHTGRLPLRDERDQEWESTLSEPYRSRPVLRKVELVEQAPGEAIVEYLGLRVRVPDTLLSSDADGTLLKAPLISPALSPGFALARGRGELSTSRPTLRVYFGARERNTATQIFHRVLDALGDRPHWHAKVASAEDVYPRSDAVTVYLDDSQLDAIDDLLSATDGARDASAPTSIFTRSLGEGVGCAWNPAAAGVSFGQHRSRVVAKLVISRAQARGESADLEEVCRSHGIDPHHIWRDQQSPLLSFLSRPAQETRTGAGVGHP